MIPQEKGILMLRAKQIAQILIAISSGFYTGMKLAEYIYLN